jgi:hypothetical protein
MKKMLTIIAIALISLSSCKKQEQDPTPQNNGSISNQIGQICEINGPDTLYKNNIGNCWPLDQYKYATQPRQSGYEIYVFDVNNTTLFQKDKKKTTSPDWSQNVYEANPYHTNITDSINNQTFKVEVESTTTKALLKVYNEDGNVENIEATDYVINFQEKVCLDTINPIKEARQLANYQAGKTNNSNYWYESSISNGYYRYLINFDAVFYYNNQKYVYKNASTWTTLVINK